MYENTHIISSKVWSEYEDFPMPSDYPEYPNHAQLQRYFESYAQHFQVLSNIRFQTEVLEVLPQEAGYLITYKDAEGVEQHEEFTHVMIANGHHWNPRHPELPGEYTGEYLHSHDFKGVNDEWRAKRVLVIGAGNSACDVAVESARLAAHVSLSVRSAQWFLPKFIFGKPSDVMGSRIPTWVPSRLRQWILTVLVKLLQGNYEKNYGLPQPKKPILSHHPTVNSDLLDFIRHGRITPRNQIVKVEGKSVTFADDKTAEFDTIVACTGFKITFPFLSKDIVNFEDAEQVPLYLKMIPEHLPNLYFIGLFQPLGCIWPLADYQAKLAVQEIIGRYKRPEPLGKAIAREMKNPHLKFEAGKRHSTEVDYHRFRKDLKAALKKAHIDIGKAPAGRTKYYKTWQQSCGLTRYE